MIIYTLTNSIKVDQGSSYACHQLLPQPLVLQLQQVNLVFHEAQRLPLGGSLPG